MEINIERKKDEGAPPTGHPFPDPFNGIEIIVGDNSPTIVPPPALEEICLE